MRIVPAGDSTVFARFERRIDVSIHQRVMALARRVERAHVQGVLDIVPAFCSLAVHFDPLRTDQPALFELLDREPDPTIAAPEPTREPVRVPVCYDMEFALDLDTVAAAGGLAPCEVVELHSAREYRVFMSGFMPGFAYMGMLDARIAVPRLATPRVRVPAGSVAIAGTQTGIYPAESPGGWRIIGRTPLLPFDPARPDPFLFAPGDTVAFYPIDRAEFERLRAH